jgi:lipoprotein-releasing system permease protein
VGVDFAEKYGLLPGDDVALVFAGGSTVRVEVSAVVDLGSAAANERQAFVEANLPRTLSGWSSDEYSAIQTQLLEPFDSADVAASWRSKLPGLSVSEWQDENADLLTALQSQSASSYMIQVFVLVAVALGIASTLAISAVQKTRQIGILKAMGLRRQALGPHLPLAGEHARRGRDGGRLALGFGLIWSFSFIPVPFSIRPEPGFIASSAVGHLGRCSPRSSPPARRRASTRSR